MGVLYSPRDKKNAQRDIQVQAKENERGVKWSYMRKVDAAQQDTFNIMPSVRFAHDAKVIRLNYKIRSS
jgi:hypothetical protein